MNDERDRPPLEIGWITAGPMSETDRRAVEQARREAKDQLKRRLPEFDWRMPLLRRDELSGQALVDPVDLLGYAVGRRDRQRWDMAVAVTEAELVSRTKPFSLATFSRALETAVVSTSRLDPVAEDPEATDERRVAVIAERLTRLVLRAVGHIAGLSLADDATNLMGPVLDESALDGPAVWSDEQLARLAARLRQMADRRLEENPDYRRAGGWRFGLVALWLNRRELLQAIRQARPWQFPMRLSRLTTAAVSTLLVLMMTAEAWDLGVGLAPVTVGSLSVLSVLLTTAYVVRRQGLLVRRAARDRTEQTIVTNVATVAVVLLGMTTTFVLLASLSLVLGGLLFRGELVEGWAASVPTTVGWDHYLRMAGLTASLGLGIGSLGASFESQRYFQHVTYVDEEI